MESKKQPQVRTGKIMETNQTVIKSKVENKMKIPNVARDTEVDQKTAVTHSVPPVKKMNKNKKDLAKPGKTAKTKEKEYKEDNDGNDKSKKENNKQETFFVQILKNKIKGKIQSIKENLAAAATKEKEQRNHTGSDQNLTTTTLSTTLPKSSSPQTIPEVTTDMSSDTTDYIGGEEQNTGTYYMPDYMGAEELNNGIDDMAADYMGMDYKGTDYMSPGQEYMGDYMGDYMGSGKRTEHGKGKIDKMGKDSVELC